MQCGRQLILVSLCLWCTGIASIRRSIHDVASCNRHANQPLSCADPGLSRGLEYRHAQDITAAIIHALGSQERHIENWREELWSLPARAVWAAMFVWTRLWFA